MKVRSGRSYFHQLIPLRRNVADPTWVSMIEEEGTSTCLSCATEKPPLDGLGFSMLSSAPSYLIPWFF